MKELVGVCKCCGKEVYCLGGFFNGVLSDEKEVFCFECFQQRLTRENNP